MPAATTHYEFSKDVYLALDNEHCDKILNLHMFYLGSQGPDLFFFHKAGKGNSLSKYGSLMHHKKVKETLKYILENSKDDSDLISYAYGFACHYALDSLAHPLVCYMARHGLTDESYGDEHIRHIRMEAYYDVIILNKKGRDINTYDVNKALKVSKTDCVKLANLFKRLFKDVYNLDIAFKDIQQAIKDVPFFLSVLKPNPLKFKLFEHAENGLKMKHSFSALMLNTPMDPIVLNEEHNEYFNIFLDPETTKDSHSFLELYDIAIDKAKKLIESDFDASYIDVSFDGETL